LLAGWLVGLVGLLACLLVSIPTRQTILLAFGFGLLVITYQASNALFSSNNWQKL